MQHPADQAEMSFYMVAMPSQEATWGLMVAERCERHENKVFSAMQQHEATG